MAKPKLALIPAAQGDKFYSVLPSDGVGDFDFTRNSSATRIAPTGFIQEVGAFGSEEVTNGSFDTDSDWTKGSGWTISGGKANYDGVVSIGDLTQSISFSAGKVYKYTFTISSLTQGGVRVFVGNTVGATHSSNGTFVGYITYSSGGSTILQARSSFIGSIDNVSIVEVIGKSRLNYDLLNGKVVNCPHYLLEPASTNLITYSEDFSQSAWNKVTLSVLTNQVISPDGSLNADELIASNITATTFMYSQLTASASNYTLSFFVKYNGKQYVQLLFGSSSSTDFSNFDLVNKIVTYGNGKIENYENDWCKISLTANLNAGATEVYFWSIDNALSSRASTSIGNGTDGYYVWGAQLEEGSYPTSYIPTNGTAITRAAETANGSGDSATFNDSEGVLMAEISALANDGTNRVLSLSNGSYSNSIRIQYYTVSNQLEFRVVSSNSAVVLQRVTINNVTLFNKILVKYKLNDFAMWVNGFKLITYTSGATPIGLDEIRYDDGDGNVPFYGKTRELQYFDSALTDAQLETLTSWTSLQEMITSQLYTNY